MCDPCRTLHKIGHFLPSFPKEIPPVSPQKYSSRRNQSIQDTCTGEISFCNCKIRQIWFDLFLLFTWSEQLRLRWSAIRLVEINFIYIFFKCTFSWKLEIYKSSKLNSYVVINKWMKIRCGLRERFIVVVVLTQHDDRHMSLHKPLTLGDLQKSIANVASELAASMYFSSPMKIFCLHYIIILWFHKNWNIFMWLFDEINPH